MGPMKVWTGIMFIFTGLFFMSAQQIKIDQAAAGKVSLLYYPEDVEAQE